MSLPKTPEDFMTCIARERHRWCLAGDQSAFWLQTDPHRLAEVTFEHGRLIVTLNPAGYWFLLADIRGPSQGWTWQQQVGRKLWCRGEHMALLDALCDLLVQR